MGHTDVHQTNPGDMNVAKSLPKLMERKMDETDRQENMRRRKLLKVGLACFKVFAREG
jgi:hypothetical protein